MAQSTAESPARFEDLNLSPAMLAAVAAAEYTHPTPIQAGLIPRALAGVDVLGQARTGTGKTAAFTIPILEIIDLTKKHHGAQALVLVPTRELAVQVREEVVKLSHGRKVHSVAIYGGKPIKGQIDKLRRGAEVVIGTPGRVLDHLARGTLELRDLKMVVLDEADRMLDIGFRPDIEKILRRCPQSRQTLLLSATVPPPVERLSKRYMRDPETLNFSPKDVSVETIEQFYFTVDGTRKFELLEKLLEREQPRQAIVFCRTKRGTDKIYQRLTKKMKDVAAIHGDLAQGARDRVMAGFRAGTVRYLVATDVVGRGIDVSNISHIINYDIPQFCDDYVHRVGRTGRMGREGVAYTFVSPEEGNELTRIEMRINLLLKRGEMPGFSSSEPAATSVAASGPPRVRGEGEPEGAEETPAPAPPAAKPSGRKYRRAL
jgi:ATP-dependent RNA helicase DeaD